jgi:phage terminase small subunit
MGPLKNSRHEKFVQLLLEGKGATDAHEQAGYARDDGNAARLKANPKVQARLAELQTEIASKTKITVEGLMPARKQRT